MSWSREAATNELSSASAPATKREFFHASKYSDIVGVITTSAVNASCGVGRHSRAAASSSEAFAWKSRAAATRKSASGSASPKPTLPSPSRSGFTPSRREPRLGAPQRGLEQEEEVAGLLVGLAGGRADRERHGVLRVRLVAAGVDDHVEVGQRRHARHDALHLLIGGIGLAEGRLHALDQPRDLLTPLIEQALVVEARLLGRRVIGLGVGRQCRGVLLQGRRVREQVVLDRAQVGLRRRRRRLRARFGIVTAAPGECGDGDERRH